MNPILSLNISLGFMLVLVGIMVYCMYKTIEQVPKIFKAIKEARQSQKEIQDYINTISKKSLKSNKPTSPYPPIVSDLKLSGRDMEDFNEKLEEEPKEIPEIKELIEDNNGE